MTTTERSAGIQRLEASDSAQAARVLRTVCANFPTGVTVVTSMKSDGQPRGITVNSFTSVSLSPPLVAVCIDKRSSSCRSIAEARSFAVHFLSSEQWESALVFARPGDQKFEGVDWSLGAQNVPLLDRFVAALECKVIAEHPGGDHVIVVGEVTASYLGDASDGVLGFFRGRFVRIDSELGLFRPIPYSPMADRTGMEW